MDIPQLTGQAGILVITGVTLLCYRTAISPTVRALSARPTFFRLALATVLILLLLALPAPHVDAPFRWFIAFVTTLLTWQGATTDYDLTEPVPAQRRAKLMLLMTAGASLFWPPALLLWLAVYCGKLRGWKHHAMLPVRILKAYLAWFVTAALLNIPSTGPALLLVLGCVSLSHYVKPAWSKARLGTRPWSWAWHNQTHYLAASAYCWGWARFLRPALVTRALKYTRLINRPLSLLTMATEAAGLLAFFDQRLFIGVLTATALFNVAVVLASGIFFWENICTHTALAITALMLPKAHHAEVFSWPVALAALVIIVLSVADLLWQPAHLAWWDTPFTARIHWQVETVSGARQGLYNDFLCPYEREFGRVLGYFLTDEPVFHGHLGIVWDRELRDRIVEADGDRAALHALKQSFGTSHRDEAESLAHEAFLSRTFTQLNDGIPKGPLPRRLRRFKAPGGQLYRWGDLPPYRGAEPVRRITIRYQERYYRPTTGDFLLLTDRLVRTIELPHPTTQENPPCARSSSTAAPTSESS